MKKKLERQWFEKRKKLLELYILLLLVGATTCVYKKKER